MMQEIGGENLQAGVRRCDINFSLAESRFSLAGYRIKKPEAFFRSDLFIDGGQLLIVGRG